MSRPVCSAHGDRRVDQGIRLFNEGEFFACHDVWEDYWSELVGADKPFFQGLIHAAVCLFHFEEGNLGGARRMYGSCRAYLSPFAPQFAGIDVEGLLRDMEVCFAELLAAESGRYPFQIRIDPSAIPIIRHNRPTNQEPADEPLPSED